MCISSAARTPSTSRGESTRARLDDRWKANAYVGKDRYSGNEGVMGPTMRAETGLGGHTEVEPN